MNDRILYLHRWVLDSINEYTTTLPSATTVGKFWKRDEYVWRRWMGYPPESHVEDWSVGCYAECDDPNKVSIIWFKVMLLEGPEPLGYRAPDWSNYGTWKRERELERSSQC